MKRPESPLSFAPSAKLSLVQSVAEQIIGHIHEGRLKPGDRLPPERVLMQMMHVGRSTLREALQMLVTMDLIEVRHGSGTVVKNTFELAMLRSGLGGMLDLHQRPAPSQPDQAPRRKRPAHIPPQFHIIPCPSMAEIMRGLGQWAARCPQYMQVETVGESPQGLPMLLCRITDYGVADEDKQVVLITDAHSGLERRAVSSLLKLIKWLISGDPLAEAIRRQQIVLVMPACEPDGYESRTTDNVNYYTERSGKVYVDWTWEGPENPRDQPEAMAIKAVMDQYQPDLHQDVHGIWYQEATCWESTGISWMSSLYRNYIPRIPQLMNEAAEAAGFLISGGEDVSGQILSTIPEPGVEHWFYGASLGHAVLPGLYAYYKYHTMAQIMEVGWDESALIRLQRLLRIGNEVWRGEYYPGYPTNQLGCWISVAISAWGTTAAQRRKSRVDLWQKLPNLSFVRARPEPRNSFAAIVTTTPEARARYISKPDLDSVVAELEHEARFDGTGLQEFLRQSPARDIGFDRPSYHAKAEPIQHGIAVRLLLPHAAVRFSHLKLDGHDLLPSETDGYTVYHNPGTIVQVNIPPGKVQDIHIVTAVFDFDEKRSAGFEASDWELGDGEESRT